MPKPPLSPLSALLPALLAAAASAAGCAATPPATTTVAMQPQQTSTSAASSHGEGGRDWSRIDADRDHSVSPAEMEAWLKANPGPLAR